MILVSMVTSNAKGKEKNDLRPILEFIPRERVDFTGKDSSITDIKKVMLVPVFYQKNVHTIEYYVGMKCQNGVWRYCYICH